MKKRLYALILVCVILLSTGCGSSDYIKKDKKTIVTYEKTGQNLQKNILCQPKDKELLKLYQKYEKQMDVKLKDLPTCDNFKVTSGN